MKSRGGNGEGNKGKKKGVQENFSLKSKHKGHVGHCGNELEKDLRAQSVSSG